MSPSVTTSLHIIGDTGDFLDPADVVVDTYNAESETSAREQTINNAIDAQGAAFDLARRLQGEFDIPQASCRMGVKALLGEGVEHKEIVFSRGVSLDVLTQAQRGTFVRSFSEGESDIISRKALRLTDMAEQARALTREDLYRELDAFDIPLPYDDLQNFLFRCLVRFILDFQARNELDATQLLTVGGGYLRKEGSQDDIDCVMVSDQSTSDMIIQEFATIAQMYNKRIREELLPNGAEEAEVGSLENRYPEVVLELWVEELLEPVNPNDPLGNLIAAMGVKSNKGSILDATFVQEAGQAIFNRGILGSNIDLYRLAVYAYPPVTMEEESVLGEGLLSVDEQIRYGLIALDPRDVVASPDLVLVANNRYFTIEPVRGHDMRVGLQNTADLIVRMFRNGEEPRLDELGSLGYLLQVGHVLRGIKREDLLGKSNAVSEQLQFRRRLFLLGALQATSSFVGELLNLYKGADFSIYDDYAAAHKFLLTRVNEDREALRMVRALDVIRTATEVCGLGYFANTVVFPDAITSGAWPYWQEALSSSIGEAVAYEWIDWRDFAEYRSESLEDHQRRIRQREMDKAKAKAKAKGMSHKGATAADVGAVMTTLDALSPYRLSEMEALITERRYYFYK